MYYLTLPIINIPATPPPSQNYPVATLRPNEKGKNTLVNNEYIMYVHTYRNHIKKKILPLDKILLLVVQDISL